MSKLPTIGAFLLSALAMCSSHAQVALEAQAGPGRALFATSTNGSVLDGVTAHRTIEIPGEIRAESTATSHFADTRLSVSTAILRAGNEATAVSIADITDSFVLNSSAFAGQEGFITARLFDRSTLPQDHRTQIEISLNSVVTPAFTGQIFQAHQGEFSVLLPFQFGKPNTLALHGMAFCTDDCQYEYELKWLGFERITLIDGTNVSDYSFVSTGSGFNWAAAVPEPSGAVQICVGLALLGLHLWRRKTATAPSTRRCTIAA